MYLAVKCFPVVPTIAMSPLDNDVRDFLLGESDGEDLFHALYDHVLDEPVPQRLLAILRS